MEKNTLDIIKKLEEKLKIDSEIDQSKMDEHLLKVAHALADWNTYVQQKVWLFKELEVKADEKFKELYSYYKYEFDLTLDKHELKTWINADTEYTQIKKEMNKLEVIIGFCERAIKIVEGSSWNIKNIIEYRKALGTY